MTSPTPARPRTNLRLTAIVLLWLPAAVLAECAPGRLNLRLDNDLLSGLGRDGGYTNGFQLVSVSPALRDDGDAGFLPWPAGALNRYLGWLQPDGDERYAQAGVGLALFTPTEHEATGLQPADRPYAAVLLAGVGYTARSGDHLRSAQLRIGMVGPSVRGGQLQNAVHTLTGSEKWRGWANQLQDEPVFQLLYERLRRWSGPSSADGLGTDVIAHWGGSLGSFQTYANAGFEWRIGRNLPADFGSDPMRPAARSDGGLRRTARDGTTDVHLFASVDLRAVARNITLDGNTWRESARVDKRGFVVDSGIGVSVVGSDWTLTFARYIRSREFAGQKDRPVFGSLALSYAL